MQEKYFSYEVFPMAPYTDSLEGQSLGKLELEGGVVVLGPTLAYLLSMPFSWLSLTYLAPKIPKPWMIV